MTSPQEPMTMPAAFFGRGNPMNALERNRYTEARRTFGQSVPRPRAKDFDYHLGLGAKLAPLRQYDVLVIGSGNVVHNPRMNRQLADVGYDWAQRFHVGAKARMLDDPTAVVRLDGHADTI